MSNSFDHEKPGCCRPFQKSSNTDLIPGHLDQSKEEDTLQAAGTCVEFPRGLEQHSIEVQKSITGVQRHEAQRERTEWIQLSKILDQLHELQK